MCIENSHWLINTIQTARFPHLWINIMTSYVRPFIPDLMDLLIKYILQLDSALGSSERRQSSQ